MLIPKEDGNNFVDGIIMFFSYVFGGFIPLSSYLFLSIPIAITFSVVFAGIGLFLLGSTTSRFTNVKWWKMGSRILLLGAISTAVGFVVGYLADQIR